MAELVKEAMLTLDGMGIPMLGQEHDAISFPIEVDPRPVAAGEERDRVRARAHWLLRQVPGAVELALEVRVPTAHERDDHVQRLLEPGEDPVLREAEGARPRGRAGPAPRNPRCDLQRGGP